jgi:hypothetical protein
MVRKADAAVRTRSIACQTEIRDDVKVIPTTRQKPSARLVIVAPIVPEILDEHIAEKLVSGNTPYQPPARRVSCRHEAS